MVKITTISIALRLKDHQASLSPSSAQIRSNAPFWKNSLLRWRLDYIPATPSPKAKGQSAPSVQKARNFDAWSAIGDAGKPVYAGLIDDMPRRVTSFDHHKLAGS